MVALHDVQAGVVYQLQAGDRVRAVAHDVSRAQAHVDPLAVEVGQHGFQRFEIGVYVAEDGVSHGGSGPD